MSHTHTPHTHTHTHGRLGGTFKVLFQKIGLCFLKMISCTMAKSLSVREETARRSSRRAGEREREKNSRRIQQIQYHVHTTAAGVHPHHNVDKRRSRTFNLRLWCRRHLSLYRHRAATAQGSRMHLSFQVVDERSEVAYNPAPAQRLWLVSLPDAPQPL